jgi:hypothetical protein
MVFTEFFNAISNNIILVTLIGSFFGALFGVSIPAYYLEINSEIRLRKALKAELKYNIERINVLGRLLTTSGIFSPFLDSQVGRNRVDLYILHHPFPLKICSSIVFEEKWIEISRFREELVIKLKKYYEQIQELQEIVDYIIEHQKQGGLDNEFLIKYANDQKTLLLNDSRDLLQYHEFNCFGLFNAIWQRFMLK